MPRVELHGHRGARGLFPENTIPGFAGALAIGVDALELDVALTADGVVVVTHDAALNPDLTRDATGAWLDRPGPLVRSLPLRALQAYDVGRIRPGTAYAAAFAGQTACDGARIPRLADVLRLDPTVAFSIEIKTCPPHPDRAAPPAVIADAVLAEVDRAGAVPRARLLAFDWRVLRHLVVRRPGLALAWLTRSSLGPEAVAAAGGRIWGPDHSDLTPALVKQAHALGLRVVPWTVNQPERMRALVAAGVDGLATDRPDLARSILRAAGHALAPVRRVDPALTAP